MKKINRAAFAQAHHQGLTRKALAAHFGINTRTVTVIRKELGLPLDQPSRGTAPNGRKLDRDHIRRLVEEGHTTRHIAEQLGCNENTISRIRTELGIAHERRGRPMTETRLHAIWQMLFDGWSHEEIHRTEGADVETIRRYFPGTAWTPKQAGEHQAALRLLNPRHFNHHPKTYDRTKYEACSVIENRPSRRATTHPRPTTPEACPSQRGGSRGRAAEQVPGGVIGHPDFFEALRNDSGAEAQPVAFAHHLTGERQ